MLHTKSQGHWPFVPEKKIFKGVLPYMGMLVILVMTHVTINICYKFTSLNLRSHHINLSSIGLVVSEKTITIYILMGLQWETLAERSTLTFGTYL